MESSTLSSYGTLSEHFAVDASNHRYYTIHTSRVAPLKEASIATAIATNRPRPKHLDPKHNNINMLSIGSLSKSWNAENVSNRESYHRINSQINEKLALLCLD